MNGSERHWRIPYRVPGEKHDRVVWAYTEDEALAKLLALRAEGCTVPFAEAPAKVPEEKP